MQRLLHIIIGVIMVSVLGVSCTYVYAQTVAPTDAAQLQAQINERARLIADLEKEIKAYAELADKSSKEAETLNGYIKGLERQVSSVTLDIKKSQTSIDKSNLEITQLSTEIQGGEEKLVRIRAGLIETIYSQYIADDINVIENFLANRNILSSVQDIDHLQVIQEEMDKLVKDVVKEKEVLETNKEGELKKKQELESEKVKLQTKQKSLDIAKAEQKKELALTKNQEKNYKAILDDKKKKKIAFEKEIFEYEKKLTYVLNPGSLPKANSTALEWPVDNVYITQKFGKTNASGRLYVSGTHNGVDFRAPVGTPLKSAGNGKVAGTGDTDKDCRGVSFGKWILIKYDNGLATTYGHLSQISVTPGQAVSAGDVVGYSGNTGYSTGPHLHVSMYAADAVNPVTRPSNSCPGTSMTMPVSAVNAYLDPLVYFPK
ncbi:MAG: peptidoglycan DD-metalloendopeptidase family protein [Patescibacteria group bacterium]